MLGPSALATGGHASLSAEQADTAPSSLLHSFMGYSISLHRVPKARPETGSTALPGVAGLTKFNVPGLCPALLTCPETDFHDLKKDPGVN